MHELIHRFTFYSPCLGCRLYRYAVRVPLCKQLNCMVIVTGSIFVNPATATIINTSQEVMYYCKTLLSNFGINLMYNIVDEEKYKKRDQKIPYTSTDKDNICSCCIFKDNYRLLHSSSRQLPDNKKYFEQFAIPAAAKIISRVLAGKKPDYLQEIMNTILPGENIKTNQAYIK